MCIHYLFSFPVIKRSWLVNKNEELLKKISHVSQVATNAMKIVFRLEFVKRKMRYVFPECEDGFQVLQSEKFLRSFLKFDEPTNDEVPSKVTVGSICHNAKTFLICLTLQHHMLHITE